MSDPYPPLHPDVAPAPPLPAGSDGNDDPSMKDKAAESAQAGKDAAGEVAGTAVERAKDVAGEAQNQIGTVVGEARDQLRDHAGEQHRNAVVNLRSLGDELRSMARNSEGNGPATSLVGQAADRAHGAADWLDAREPQDVLNDLRRLARRRPGAFLLGALAAGVVAGRLTRGVVASHTDDDPAASEQSPAVRSETPPAIASPPPVGPAPVGDPELVPRSRAGDGGAW